MQCKMECKVCPQLGKRLSYQELLMALPEIWLENIKTPWPFAKNSGNLHISSLLLPIQSGKKSRKVCYLDKLQQIALI